MTKCHCGKPATRRVLFNSANTRSALPLCDVCAWIAINNDGAVDRGPIQQPKLKVVNNDP